ncbi:MAG TPA: SDR family NAD(P)-dependent oxidoreductase [Microvirga sp.]|jgi:NAD(P)-dependent dehydrogenase (short-subunit alcohol dehydrogenase family)|nr:SDR family NAD(P)-dependent oxidoreductase [Microvirga sp.]
MANGKVALLTGGNRGIGRAIAVELERAGYRIALGMRRPGETVEGLSDPLRLAYDATDPAAAEALVTATIAATGRIDVAVASAGILRNVGIRDGKDADLDDLLAVNVKAPYRFARAVLPYLEAAGEGRFVVLASLSGKRVKGGNIGYQMSKHAMVALAHSVRAAGWAKGVRATALCPSYVNTEMVAGVGSVAPANMTQPEDLARLVATVVGLPNNATVAELLVNWQHEDMV